MATEEATGEGCKRTCTNTPTPMVPPPRLCCCCCCFHGGFHALPLNLPPGRVAAEPLVKQLLNIPSALTPSPRRSLVPFTVDYDTG